MPTPKAKAASEAARRTKAIEMRNRGERWDTIAETLGYANRSAACQAVTRALEQNLKQLSATVEIHREQALERLDMMYRAVVAVLESKHLRVSGGTVVRDVDPETGKLVVIEDDAPILAAVDRLVKIEESRSRLLGTNAVVKSEVTTYQYTVNGVDPKAVQ